MLAPRRGPRVVSEGRIVERTGKTTEEWKAILDAFNVELNGHGATVNFLRATYQLDGWWALAIATRYEYQVGLRQEPILPVSPDNLDDAPPDANWIETSAAADPNANWIDELHRPDSRTNWILQHLNASP
ncbi:MAG: DUF4287 domain-containing protein [Phototrophicaceae bacterium]|jgi:hypothetical protein